jgi:hypothetical protein
MSSTDELSGLPHHSTMRIGDRVKAQIPPKHLWRYSRQGAQADSHLLILGYTYTGMTGVIEKPPDAWTPE